MPTLPEVITSARTGAEHRADHVALHIRYNKLENPPDYTTTNVVTTRSLDANSANQDTISDVLGTLINDLIAAGILT